MEPVPQFGYCEPGRDYADRPAVFGVVRQEGRIALVRVEKPGHASWWDLPGGALDAGEGEAEALAREFGEETGLKVRPLSLFARADQYFVNTEGQAYDNRGGFWSAELVGRDDSLKVEDDHTLVWMTPPEAIKALRHDAHAWALTVWLRRGL